MNIAVFILMQSNSTYLLV